MSFLLQRVRGGALMLAEVSGDVLRIGRGTRARPLTLAVVVRPATPLTPITLV